MSFNINGGNIVTIRAKIASSAVVAAYTAVSRTTVLSVTCTENNGGTPNLSLEIFDGTNSFFLRKATAMTAGTAFVFNEPFELPAGWSIRVTSSDASGHVDVHVSYILPSAVAKG